MRATRKLPEQLDTFAERLRWLRKRHHLTLVQFGQQCGHEKSYLSRLERGVATKPTTKFIEHIAFAFGINPVWLETGEGDPMAVRNSRAHERVLDFSSTIELTTDQVFQYLESYAREIPGKPHHMQFMYTQFIIGLLGELKRRAGDRLPKDGR
jgi:transcriptional regulator with XRE-family HTH domain